MPDGFEGLKDSLKQINKGLTVTASIEEIIGIIRAELYSYFAKMNSQQKQQIEINSEFVKNLGNELKNIIGEENGKSEMLRNEIRAYLENNNVLFRELIEEVKGIKIEKPLIIPPSMEVPKEMLTTLKELKDLQEKTLGELEGLYAYYGQKKVNNAGTPERMAHKKRTKSIVIIAESTNSGTIYVGDEGVGMDTAGAKLRAGESVTMDIDLMKKEIWIDATSDGDGVTFVAMAYKQETTLPSLMQGDDR